MKKNRRPKALPLRVDEKRIIDEIWNENRFGSRLLYKELKRSGYKIPHHKVYRYLVETGKSVPNPNKQKKRKRYRYEREHTFSLVHGDWHRTTEKHPYAIVWLDDESRFVLAGKEFENATHLAHLFYFKGFGRVSTCNDGLQAEALSIGSRFFTELNCL